MGFMSTVSGWMGGVSSPGSTCLCSFLLLSIYNALSIAEIIMGVVYLDKCPAQPMIPIYLIVAGAVAIASSLIRVFVMCIFRGPKDKLHGYIFLPFFIFLIGWFFAGNSFVFSIYEPNYEPLVGIYCDRELYLFAFGTMLFYYACICVLLFLPLAALFIFCILKTKKSIEMNFGCIGVNSSKIEAETKWNDDEEENDRKQLAKEGKLERTGGPDDLFPVYPEKFPKVSGLEIPDSPTTEKRTVAEADPPLPPLRDRNSPSRQYGGGRRDSSSVFSVSNPALERGSADPGSPGWRDPGERVRIAALERGQSELESNWEEVEEDAYKKISETRRNSKEHW